MKKIYAFMIAFATLLPSCNNWLDIDPALEIREGQMFGAEQGFMDVLTGAYIRVATPTLYGLNTTMRLPELMAQHWTPVANTLSAYLGNFDFEQSDCKQLFESIWLQYYQTIINLNALLAEIDDNKGLFANGNYELIKGEAMGLRAFLHFEVLRYWGAAPTVAVMSEKAIPYTREVTKNPNLLLSLPYQEVLRRVLEDLDEAERLLANDPIRVYSNGVLNSIGTLAGVNENLPHPADEFHYFRQARFNYYAVKAAKARYYAWTGDMAKAAELALEVINAKSADDNPQFSLGAEINAGNGQLTFPTEHIFAVNNSTATVTLTPVFFNYSTAYTQTVPLLNTAFESTLHTSDIRYRANRLWESRAVPLTNTSFNYFKKYNEAEKTAVSDVPLIRLSEMYFLAVEGGNTDLFRAYRIARNLDGSIDGTLTTPEEVMARLEKEYRKEFYGEGQMFFFYKRLGRERFTWPAGKDVAVGNYRLPIPESQSVFE
ncbi:MAG: RagB/SusD family nutrient uptake outer membrane protein [Odoribacteraceae bacterium]|jgi:hypothetical protein|nr:RagB/SusD family nutrient uptake outer membrane protein [Odoribacteraceae bacterium]